MSKKALVYPAYAGEFGWELMVWQGFVRKKANSGNYDKVVGFYMPGSGYLYEDLPGELSCVSTPVPRSLSPTGVYDKELTDIVNELKRSGYEVEVLIPEHTLPLWRHQEEAEYRSFKREGSPLYDVCFHFRKMDNRPEDNDSTEYNLELLNLAHKEGLKIAVIGTSKGSEFPDASIPYEFYRDKSVFEVSQVIASSNFMVGQSSGPMHLAALCETETIVWSTSKGDGPYNLKERYTDTWNPFKVKVNYLVEPTPEEIIEIIANKIRPTNNQPQG